MRRSIQVVLAVFLALGLLLTGCSKSGNSSSSGSSSQTDLPADPSGTSDDAKGIDTSCPAGNTTAFAKTKFVGHAGLAFGVFHRYLWKPYQAGTFKKGADGRFGAFVKGGLAALFIKREIRLTAESAQANPTLCKAISAPLAKIGDTIQNAFDRLKSGDASGITDINNLIGTVTAASQQQGDTITEKDDADLTSVPK